MSKWLIALTGSCIHLLLGTVYAWSFFQTPLVESTSWSHSQVAWAFSLSIFMLGVSAAWGGFKLPRFGPRSLAMTGGFLYGLGYLLSALALKNHMLWLLYLGFGICGGTGLGLAYVTPVTTVSRWFDRFQGVAAGLVVMGFGLGALVMSKALAPFFLSLTRQDLPQTFFYLGAVFIVLLPLLALFLQNPVEQTTASVKTPALSYRKHLLARPFVILWLLFAVNIIAGMVFIAFQSPLLQDLLLAQSRDISRASLVSQGATLIAFSSVFNGVGRFFWGSISDFLGRTLSFRVLLFVQVLIFILLTMVESPLLFSVLVCGILLCYGGGFGVMPSLIKELYGARLMPVMYGSILTAWSAGGVIGPQLVAYLMDHQGSQAGFLSFIVSGTLLFTGFLLSFLLPGKIANNSS